MKPIRETNLPWREVDQRAVVLVPRKGQIHEFNEAASFLWLEANGESTVTTIAERLVEAFDVDPADAHRDAGDFFSELHALGLIRWE